MGHREGAGAEVGPRASRGLTLEGNPGFNTPPLPRGNLLPDLTAADVKTCRFHPDRAPFCPILRVGDVVKFAGQDFAKLAQTVRSQPLLPWGPRGPFGRWRESWGLGRSCRVAAPWVGAPQTCARHAPASLAPAHPQPPSPAPGFMLHVQAEASDLPGAPTPREDGSVVTSLRGN